MTSMALIGWIGLAAAVQLVIFLGVAFARHWRAYRVLKRQAVGHGGLTPHNPAEGEEAASTNTAWSGYRLFTVARREFEDAAQSVCSFYLAPADGEPLPAYSPGQFLTFRLDPDDVAAAGSQTAAPSTPLVRCYSLSTAPDPQHYRVSIKRVVSPPGKACPPGRSSSYFHDRVTTGTRLMIKAPGGHFRLISGDSPVVLIAGGIGITPLLAMLDWLVLREPHREVWLFYGVRHAGEIAFQQHLDRLASTHPQLNLFYCLSDPHPGDLENPGTRRHHGRVDLALLRLILPLRPFDFFVCGPPAMMESLVPALEEWGVPPARIHFEAFGPASVRRLATAGDRPPASDATHSARTTLATEAAAPNPIIEFARSQQRHSWDPQFGSLLEFAEAKGVAVDSGCRAGGCGTCQTVILSGEVAYRQAPDFDPEPGCCLLCVSVPKTDVTLEV